MHDARKCLKNQLHSISGFNSGLQVRVLPGSPLISPNRFTFHQFSRLPGVAAVAEWSATESKTPDGTSACLEGCRLNFITKRTLGWTLAENLQPPLERVHLTGCRPK